MLRRLEHEMEHEQQIERLTRHNFKYFCQKIKDLCGEAALEGVYLCGIVAYYDPVSQKTAYFFDASGDKCSLAHILGTVSQEMAGEDDSE